MTFANTVIGEEEDTIDPSERLTDHLEDVDMEDNSSVIAHAGWDVLCEAYKDSLLLNLYLSGNTHEETDVRGTIFQRGSRIMGRATSSRGTIEQLALKGLEG